MSTPRPSFTERVRQELQAAPMDGPEEAFAELAGLLRVAGSLVRAGGGPLQWRLSTPSGAVARRAHGLLATALGIRPELQMRQGVGGRRSWGLAVPAEPVGRAVGLLDDDGHLLAGLPERHLRLPEPGTAALRGLVLGAGSVSSPSRPPHAEIAVPSAVVADQATQLLQGLIGYEATVGTGRSGLRVVLKSRQAIADLLAAVGAAQAFIAFDDQQLRRGLRNQATRLANADSANLRRSSQAAAQQVRTVERAIDAVGWDALDDDLRTVALTRLANPGASLAEVGDLCDPPVGKATVHRRLQRLAALADEGGGSPGRG